MVGEVISHYRVLAELGQGGMGVVYKARDLTLDRFVALKFLPRYLTADKDEKERFYHEARAAAAINHAHVTTIYEIGEHDGQIFLAMEYVEGETLKTYLARETPSVAKALDMAMQVAQALAAAHEQGIVHRDIKSDNIMITPKGEIKVADFGLAKLQGATRLTQAGSTLGTVAYMSPEQARGDDVDHRSDIFSFGVVLYEILSGRLPFRGEHQAALLYALMNEDPPPLARFNNDVVPELERIVAKALAKDPAERYQHMDDLVADLRHVRRSVESMHTAALARTAITPGLTMPPQSTVPSAPSVIPIAESRRKRSLLRYIIPAGVLVVALLLLVIFNPFNFQLSVQQGRAAEQGSSLAVLYFQNIADPDDKDHTSDMLTDLLTTALSQDKSLQVVSRERLYDIQKDMGQGDVRTISPSLAQKLAERAGVTMMLLGSVVQREPSLAVTARVVNVKSGDIISSERLSGFSPQQVFALVDTLALLVRNDVRPKTASSPTVEKTSVADVTTNSPEAYRYYLEGMEFGRRFLLADARRALNRAIDLDGNFAMAYFALAELSVFNDPVSMKPYLEKAWELRSRVTEKERMEIEAQYLDIGLGETEKAAGVLEKFVEKYPYEVQSYANLAAAYTKMGLPEKSLTMLQRLLQVDSLAKDQWNDIAYQYASLGRRAEAFEATDRYMKLVPGEPNPYDSKGEIYTIFGEPDSAAICYQQALNLRADFNSAEKLGWRMVLLQNYAAARAYLQQFGRNTDLEQQMNARMDEVTIPMHQGRLHYARQLYLSILPELRREKLNGLLVEALRSLVVIVRQEGDFAAMAEYARQLVDVHKETVAALWDGRELLAEALQLVGDTDGKSRVLAELGHAVQGHPANVQKRYLYSLARIAADEGAFGRALETFKQCFGIGFSKRAPQLCYGIVLLKTGNLDAAITEFKSVTLWVPISFPPFRMSSYWVEWPMTAVLAHYWLGVAYEQQGRAEDAVNEYKKFLEIWKNADFSSPEMKDARARVTRLQRTADR